MKKLLLPAMLGLAMALPVSNSAAQQPELNTQFNITDLGTDFVSTPTIERVTGKRTSRRTSWLEVEVEFRWQVATEEEATDPYADDVEVKVYVLLQPGTAAHPVAVLSGSSTFQHVPAGESVQVAMFVSPRLLDRLYAGGRVPSTASSAVRNVGAVISRGGSPVALRVLRGNDEFWKLPELSVMENTVISKSQTPFAHLSWDYYEQEKIGD